MKPRLYLETTIPGYLTARPTRDPLMTGQLKAPQKWWNLRQKILNCSFQILFGMKLRAVMRRL
jgi:hypothetical protein